MTTEEPLAENIPHESQPLPASNALSHTNLVECILRKAGKQMEEERKLINLFRQELQLMKTKVENLQHQLMNSLKPAIEGCCQELNTMQLQQKEDNIGFQNQIIEMKKQKSVISQMISFSSKHTQELIDQVGCY